MLFVCFATLLATPAATSAKNFHNVHFKSSDDGNAQGSRDVMGILAGEDGLQLRFFDSGKAMRPSGNGHAWLAPVDGTFEQMCVTTAGETPAMLAVQMNLHAAGDGSVTFTSFDSLAARDGGALADTGASSLMFDLRGNGSNRLTFELPSGSPFTVLDMQSTVGIESIRQVRVAADLGAVPEPLGLGGAALGALSLLRLRRRRPR